MKFRILGSKQNILKCCKEENYLHIKIQESKLALAFSIAISEAGRHRNLAFKNEREFNFLHRSSIHKNTVIRGEQQHCQACKVPKIYLPCSHSQEATGEGSTGMQLKEDGNAEFRKQRFPNRRQTKSPQDEGKGDSKRTVVHTDLQSNLFQREYENTEFWQ